MKYQLFFSLIALISGAMASLGLILSLPKENPFPEPALVYSANTLQSDEALLGVQTPLIFTETTDTSEDVSVLTAITPSIHSQHLVTATTTQLVEALFLSPKVTASTTAIFSVPFFSQLTDITAASWKKVGCGITSLAMLIEYYSPGKITSVDTLLDQGIAIGAYSDAVGWSYNGLITVANKYGLSGSTHDYKNATMDTAFTALETDVHKGPVMASVHYTFKASNPIPHLVIINGVKNGFVYYNDPAAKAGGGSITVAQFKEGWKKDILNFIKQPSIRKNSDPRTASPYIYVHNLIILKALNL